MPRRSQFKRPVDESRPVDIIAQQLRAINPLYMAEFDVRQLIAIDENTLRLHSRGRRGVINVGIHYNRGSDLYDVKAYRLRSAGLEAKEIYSNSGIYVDQLDPVLDAIFRVTS